MYKPKVSRIRPTGRSRNSRFVRYIFLGVIVLVILAGVLQRVANAAPEYAAFSNPMAQYLHEEGVSFIHRKDNDTLIILRAGTPPVFKEGYTTPQAVCQRLKPVGAPAIVVLFDQVNSQEAFCN